MNLLAIYYLWIGKHHKNIIMGYLNMITYRYKHLERNSIFKEY